MRARVRSCVRTFVRTCVRAYVRAMFTISINKLCRNCQIYTQHLVKNISTRKKDMSNPPVTIYKSNNTLRCLLLLCFIMKALFGQPAKKPTVGEVKCRSQTYIVYVSHC